MDEKVKASIETELGRLAGGDNRITAQDVVNNFDIDCNGTAGPQQVMSKEILAKILADIFNDPSLHLPGQAPNLSAADVEDVIDQSGITVDTVYAAQVCRKQGPGIS